jgi:hypothetical protein
VDAASIHVSLAYLSEVRAVGFGKKNIAVVISGYAQAWVSLADYPQRRQLGKELEYPRHRPGKGKMTIRTKLQTPGNRIGWKRLLDDLPISGTNPGGKQ